MEVITETKQIIIEHINSVTEEYGKENIEMFTKWMYEEYKNYMLMTREQALYTLSKLKKLDGDYVELVRPLEENINRYGSLKSYFLAACELINPVLKSIHR